MGLLGFQPSTDKTEKSLDLSPKSTQRFDDYCSEEANRSGIESSLGPITPDAHKENGDFPVDLSSPLTVVKKIPKLLTFDSNANQVRDPVSCTDNYSSPKTPKDGVFDPFAPGPEDRVWAPQCKKYSDEARSSVARRLNFSYSFKDLGNEITGDDAESISDEEIYESVYEILLDAIVSKQTESVLAELSVNAESSKDGCRTPPSAPRLTGIADTCPGAPMKPTGKSRIIHMGLCRKLEF